MPKQVLLIRHGDTDWNAEQRWQGHTDIPLNQTGIAQAERLAGSSSCCSLEALLSSDLERAHQTAQIIASRLEISLCTAKRLREVDVGQAEGLGYQEVVEHFGPETIRRWRSVDPADLDFALEQGETKRKAVRRALKVLTQFLHSSEAESIGVVTHGMLIRTLIHYLFPEVAKPLQDPHCGHFSLTYDTSLTKWSLISELGQDFEESWKDYPSSDLRAR